MSISYDNFDIDEDDASDQPSNPLKELRKQNRLKDKQLSELQARLDALTESARSQSVKDVLTSKGLNPKIAAFIPKDVTSVDEVAAWVDEYADAFAPIPSETESAPAPSMFDPNLAAMERIASVQSSGQPFTSDPTQIAAQIAAANSPEELNKLLFGSANGPMAS